MEDKNLQILANRVKAERKGRDLSQEQFADMIGISLSSFARLENGKGSPSVETLEAIAKAVDCTIADLFRNERAEEYVYYNLSTPESKAALGKRLRSLMIEKGLSVEKLSEKSGILANTLYSYLNGARSPNAGTLARIAEALGVTIRVLLGAKDVPDETLPAQQIETASEQVMRLERKIEDLKTQVVRGFAIIETLLRAKQR